VPESSGIYVLSPLVGTEHHMPMVKTGDFRGFYCGKICQVFDHDDGCMDYGRTKIAEGGGIN
jgi:hypothetical protein